MSNKEALKLFVQSNVFRWAANTKIMYENTLNQFFTFYTGRFSRVKTADIEAWLAFLLENGASNETLKSKLSELRMSLVLKRIQSRLKSLLYYLRKNYF